MRSQHHRDDKIERLRERLLRDPHRVPSVDFGAGSQGDIRTVKGIAQSSLKRPKHAQALAALAHHIGARRILELGTSLGTTAAYLARQGRQVWTLEGNPHLGQLATTHWKELNLDTITCVVGEFGHTLEGVLETAGPFDLVFIDGNHRGRALESYVAQILPHLSPEGVVVCDDIHWSGDMEAGWNRVTSAPHWTLMVDFYEWGLLSRNPNLARELKAVRF